MAAALAAFIVIPMSKGYSKDEAFIIEHEGKKLKAYDDGTGTWTIGYGSTWHYDLNRPVQRGDVITDEQADRFLRLYNSDAKRDILNSVKVPINENQLIALLSFYYNFCPTKFKNSTLFRLLNQGVDKTIVANEFDKWILVKDKKTGLMVKSNGQIKRRAKEKALFLK